MVVVGTVYESICKHKFVALRCVDILFFLHNILKNKFAGPKSRRPPAKISLRFYMLFKVNIIIINRLH